MEKEMEKEQNIIIMVKYYLKEIILMEKEKEKERKQLLKIKFII